MNQSYKVLVIDLFFFISFFLHLPISSIDTITGFKDSYFISYLIFTSLSQPQKMVKHNETIRQTD